jgi:hypothetical protein
MVRTGERPRAQPRGDGLRGLRSVAHWLDSAFTIPGTRIRVGLDPLIGLIPGAGDVVGGIASLYVLYVAIQLGAPGSVVARIALNAAIDAAVGAVPLLGDLFDVGWRANTRNLALLEGWLQRPAQTRRASRLVVALVALALVALVALAAWAAVRVAGALLAAL